MKACVSMFSQMLAMVKQPVFERIVRTHQAEARSKGFSSWDQCVAMLFAQVAQADSLREIENGLATCMGTLSHLGLAQAPSRSALLYAKAHRPWHVYEQLFYERIRTVCRWWNRSSFSQSLPLLVLDSMRGARS